MLRRSMLFQIWQHGKNTLKMFKRNRAGINVGIIQLDFSNTKCTGRPVVAVIKKTDNQLL